MWIYENLILQVKFVNKGALKKHRDRSCFIYGNHTGFYDAFTPNLISFPHKNSIIVGADIFDFCEANIEPWHVTTQSKTPRIFPPWCFAVKVAYSVVIILPLILHAFR